MANNQYVNKVQFGNTIVIDISQDTVTSSAMLSGYTAHAANGASISGNIATKTSNDLTASGTTVTVPSGYYNTTATKTITDNNLIAGNIKSGVTIFGVTGAYEGSDGGGVTQDENGYIILPSTGSGGSGNTPSATQHTIHLDFTDSTSIDIPVYYTDTLVETMITEYTPTTYGQKTVSGASLDNVTWYSVNTTWETLYNNTAAPNADSPYNYFWLSSMADVYPTNGSMWKITIDDVVYNCVAYTTPLGQYQADTICIGNSKYSGEADNNSNAPFNFYNAGWGAWVGDTELSTTSHTIKIERLTTI